MQRYIVPTIYYWEDYVGKDPVKMTAAFNLQGSNYGLSFHMENNKQRNRLNKQKLVTRTRDTLDILLHHGKEVLDSKGNIDYRKVKDSEARRFFNDPLWKDRLDAFKKAVIVKDITQEEALKLKLL